MKKKDRLKNRETALLEPIVGRGSIDDLDKNFKDERKQDEKTEKTDKTENTECAKLKKKKQLEARRAEARELADNFRQNNALFTTGQAPLIDRAYYDQLSNKAELETSALKMQLQENQMQTLREFNELKLEYELKIRMAEQRGQDKKSKAPNSDNLGLGLGIGGLGSFPIVCDIGQIHNTKLFPTWSPEEIVEMEKQQTELNGFGKREYRYCRTLRNLAKEEKENDEKEIYDYVVDPWLDHQENNSDGKLPVYDFWLESTDYDAIALEKQHEVKEYPGCPKLERFPLYTAKEMEEVYTVEQRILLYDLNKNFPDWSAEIADRQSRRKRIREPFDAKRREIDKLVDDDDSIKEPALKKRRKGDLKGALEKEEAILLAKDMETDTLAIVTNEHQRLVRMTDPIPKVVKS